MTKGLAKTMATKPHRRARPAPPDCSQRDAEAQWAFWPKRHVLDMDAIRRGVLCVHGVGGGTGAERAGFSAKLCRLVFPELSESDTSSVWRECVWEDLSDAMDAQLSSVIREMTRGPLMDGLLEKSRKAKGLLRFLGMGGEGGKYLRALDGMTREMAAGFIAKMLDFGLDYCLYFDTGHGRRIRQRLRESIADAAKGHPEGVVLVAHSLGSVIAYDVLAEAHCQGEALPIAAFVSCGTPLDWTLRLRESLCKPECTGRGVGVTWANLYYREDYIPLYKPLPADRFPEANNIALPLPKRATPRTAHNAYWRDKEVSRIVRETVRGDSGR